MIYWIAAFFLIFYSAIKQIYIGYALTIVLIMFCLLSFKNGRTKEDLKGYFKDGAFKGLIVSRMLVLIGINTAVWMASGCTASLLFYSTKAIIPSLFLPICFLICSVFSLLLGSAFATSATIGVIVYIIGCAGGANPAMVAGAIIAGAYVGDRASPVSSSLVLLATVNEVGHSKAVAMAIKTTVIPIILSSLAYIPFSVANPIDMASLSQLDSLRQSFNIGIWAVFPAIAIIIGCIFKANMKTCLLISILTAIPVAIFYQGVNIIEIIKYSISGFLLPQNDPLYDIVKGGGVIPMLKTIYILMVSCFLAAVIQGGGLLGEGIEKYLQKPAKQLSLYLKSCIVGVIATIVGCNQTVSTVITSQLMDKAYKLSGYDKMHKMVDISYASILLSVIPPWSLTVVVPMATIQHKGYGYMLFMFFIFIAPLCNLILRMKPDKTKISNN